MFVILLFHLSREFLRKQQKDSKKKKKLLEANIKSPLTVQLLNPSLKVLSYHLLPTDTKCQSFRGGNDPPQNFQRRSDGYLTASRNTYGSFGLSKADFVLLYLICCNGWSPCDILERELIYFTSIFRTHSIVNSSVP